ncbi:MAG: hypothetical protein AMXMBFR47_44840 [Planctomycetota bacterium]
MRYVRRRTRVVLVAALLLSLLGYASTAVWNTVDVARFDGDDWGVLIDLYRGAINVTWMDAPRVCFDRSLPSQRWESYLNDWIYFAVPRCEVFPAGKRTIVAVSVPFWVIWIPYAIAASRLRRKQKQQSACPACGYCLTGNMSGICPECGVPWKLTGP